MLPALLLIAKNEKWPFRRKRSGDLKEIACWVKALGSKFQELDPWNPHGRQRELAPTNCPLIFRGAL